MKRLLSLIAFFAGFTAFSQKKAIDSVQYIPSAKDWLNDYVNLFSLNEIQSLNSIISDFEKKTTVHSLLS